MASSQVRPTTVPVVPAGDALQARELAAALVSDDKRVLGTGHRHTLLARASLAQWTAAAGDVGRAAELALPLIEDMVQVLGHDHPDTKAAQKRLTRWINCPAEPHQSPQ
jgi:hypothetical protein